MNMAKARTLEDITIDGAVELIIPNENRSVSIPVRKSARDVKIQQPKEQSAHERHGINSKSPVVYVPETMKQLLKLLKAHVFIKEGRSLSESIIIATAMKEYCTKHHPEFFSTNKSLFDSI